MFDDHYMRKRMYMVWRKDIITKAIDDVLHPNSIVDVGCSVGEFVDSFLKMGKVAYGIDNSESAKKFFMAPKDNFIMADMTDPKIKISGTPFDLCICFELVVVLDNSFYNWLADNLCTLSDQILLSVRPERQEGWVERMRSRGYFPYTYVVNRIREPLEQYKRKAAIKAIYYGMMFFRKG